MKKINIGHTNISYKKNNFFYQEKVRNGFNHNSNNNELKIFNFVPNLIDDNNKNSTWEWIDSKELTNPNNDDLKKLANILKTLHNSNAKFTKCNIRKRIVAYRKIMNEKQIKIDIIELLYKKINMILKNMDKNTPVHGDVWEHNILKTKENKIYLIDWEYCHMGDKHFELAYYIEAQNLNEEQEKIFLDEYEDYDSYLLTKHKVLVNYLTILWLYAQKELPFSPDKCIKKLKTFYKKGF